MLVFPGPEAPILSPQGGGWGSEVVKVEKLARHRESLTTPFAHYVCRPAVPLPEGGRRGPLSFPPRSEKRRADPPPPGVPSFSSGPVEATFFPRPPPLPHALHDALSGTMSTSRNRQTTCVSTGRSTVENRQVTCRNTCRTTGRSTEVSTGRFSTVEIDCRIRRYTCRNRQSISTVGFDRYFLSISTVNFRLSISTVENRQSISTGISVDFDCRFRQVFLSIFDRYSCRNRLSSTFLTRHSLGIVESGRDSGAVPISSAILPPSLPSRENIFLLALHPVLPAYVLPLLCLRLCLPALYFFALTGITIQGSPPPPPPKNRSHHLGAHSFHFLWMCLVFPNGIFQRQD